MTTSFRYSLPWVLKAVFWSTLALMLVFGLAQLMGGEQAAQLFSWQSLQLFGLLILGTLLFVYTHLFNERVEVDEAGIRIRRRVGKDIELPYTQIRRGILRQHLNKHSGEEWILHLYRSESKQAATIYVTELVAAKEFETLLSRKAQAHNIPLIRQDEEGNVL